MLFEAKLLGLCPWAVQAALEPCLVGWVFWRIDVKEETSSRLLPLQRG